MSYRLIDFEMWQKPWFDGLSPKAKLLFIYLVTSPHNDKCGTQPLARGLMSYHCGLTQVELDSILVELANKVSVVEDRIFANKFLKHQCRTGNFKSGIPNALKLLSEAVRTKLLSVCGLTEVELGLNQIPNLVKLDINRPTTSPLVTSNKEQVTSNKEQVTSSKALGVSDKSSPPKKIAIVTDEDIERLSKDPAYEGIDVKRAALKAQSWLRENPKGKGRYFTKKFFLNWLSRSDTGQKKDDGIQRNEMGQATILNGLVY